MSTPVYTSMPSLIGAVTVRFETSRAGHWLAFRDNWSGAWVKWYFYVGDLRTERRWREWGVSPVVWRFALPHQSSRPVVEVAVTKDVQIIPGRDSSIAFSKFIVGKTTLEDIPPEPGDPYPISRTRESYTYREVTLEPELVVYRVQNRSQLPDYRRPELIDGCVGVPYRLAPAGLTLARPTRSGGLEAWGKDGKDSVLVVPGPTWTAFQNYHVARYIDPLMSGAYSFDAGRTGNESRFYFHYSRRNLEIPQYQYHRSTLNPADVPDQGSAFAHDSYRKVEPPEEETDWASVFSAAFSFAASLVAGAAFGFLGVLVVSLSAYGYTLATGKDFLTQRRVSTGDRVLYGVLLVFSFAGKAVLSSFRALLVEASKSAKNPIRTPVLDALITFVVDADAANTAQLALRAGLEPNAPGALGGSVLSRQLGSLRVPEEKAEQAAMALFEAVSGGDEVDAASLVRTIEGLLETDGTGSTAGIVNAFHDLSVSTLFSPDGRGFADPYIQTCYLGYRRFVGQGWGTANLSEQASLKEPVEWLLDGGQAGSDEMRSSAYAGDYRQALDEYLRALLGADYRSVIRRSIVDRKSVPWFKFATSKDLTTYKNLRGRVQVRLGELEETVKRQGGGDFWLFFTASTFIEDRFLEGGRFSGQKSNNQRPAVVVPRDSFAAAELGRRYSGLRFWYVEYARQWMLEELIPPGAEHLYEPQQIVDAHAYVLQQLNCWRHLRDGASFDINLLATERGERVRVPAERLRPSQFDVESEWPRIARDADSWVSPAPK